MNTRIIKLIATFALLIITLNSCANGKFKKSEPFKHNTPLIKEDIRKSGQSEIAKTIEMGPKPTVGDIERLNKRKKISSQSSRNYLLIPDEFTSLKQRISLKFLNV